MQNVQTYPGSAIGLLAFTNPNGGYPQMAVGSSKYVSSIHEHLHTHNISWAALFASPYTAPGSLPVQGTGDVDGWVSEYLTALSITFIDLNMLAVRVQRLVEKLRTCQQR